PRSTNHRLQSSTISFGTRPNDVSAAATVPYMVRNLGGPPTTAALSESAPNRDSIRQAANMPLIAPYLLQSGPFAASWRISDRAPASFVCSRFTASWSWENARFSLGPGFLVNSVSEPARDRQ